MGTPLDTRERCMQLLQRYTGGQSFLGSYALLLACEHLDLNQLNELVDSVAGVASDETPDVQRRSRLWAERWGHPSRFS